jgi:hypothetical protein
LFSDFGPLVARWAAFFHAKGNSMSTGSSGRLGDVVIYRASASLAYPAIITRINANGTAELITFPPGAAAAAQSSVAHDATEKKPARWHHLPA